MSATVVGTTLSAALHHFYRHDPALRDQTFGAVQLKRAASACSGVLPRAPRQNGRRRPAFERADAVCRRRILHKSKGSACAMLATD
jgi:hypothetical protein